METKVFIYTLIDPRTDEIKYVGKTNNLKTRLSKHVNRKLNTKVSCWIRSLLKEDLLPVMEVLDEVPDSEWQFWEQHWIWLCLSWGFNLKNGTYGGDGGDVHFTADTIRKLREMNLGEKNPMYGKKHTQEAIAKIVAANLGKKRSAIGCENIRRGKLGHKVSKEARAKISESMKGKQNALGHIYKPTDETKMKISKANTGKKCSVETKMKISKANTGNIRKDNIERNKLIFTNKKQSPEQVKKRSESLKKYWADVKAGIIIR